VKLQLVIHFGMRLAGQHQAKTCQQCPKHEPSSGGRFPSTFYKTISSLLSDFKGKMRNDRRPEISLR
jgi:hypothetical protein